MNNLVLVSLSMAFLVCNLPSALSAGESCLSYRKCLRNSGNTECCIKDTKGKNHTCQTVTAALLNTTYEASKKLTGLPVAKALQPTIDSLNLGVPLSLNVKICQIYNFILGAIAKGKVPTPRVIFGK